MQNWEINISHLITVVVALGGLLAVHRFNAWRDMINHKRQLKTNYLIDAFRKLANASNRLPENSSNYSLDLEAAITDIYLFGSKVQIEMADKFCDEFESKKSAPIADFLKQLRNDLRKELAEEIVEGNVKIIRDGRKP